MLQAKQCDSPLCCTSKARSPNRAHQAICSVVIFARLLAVRRSTMAILWACDGVCGHLRETLFRGFRQNHPQQHPHLWSVHVFAVTPPSMLPSWWWNVINLNKPVFSIFGPPTDAVPEFERSKICVFHGVVFAASAAEVTVNDKTA